jgi:hypothetical protein
MKPLLTLSFWILVASAALRAADPAPEPAPPGPLLKKAGEICAWQIVYKYESKHAPGTNNLFLTMAPRKVTFTRTRALWIAVTEDLGGNVLTQCSDGLQEFVLGTRQEAPIFCPVEEDGKRTPFLVDFGAGDFPDLDWVSAATFKKTTELGGRSALFFQKDDVSAWVDEETRLPLLWKRPGESRVFQHLPPPAGMLQLPPNVAKFSEALKKDAETLARRARRGM